MNKDNHEKIDCKIKKILKENDDIVVPQKISKGIDEALQNLDNKQNFPKKKIAIALSLGALILFMTLTPLGVNAIKSLTDTIYTYIPSLGSTIKVNDLIYSLEEPITKSINSRKITLSEVYYNTETDLIIVDVQGNGKFPKDKAVLKIKNKKIKSFESSIEDMSNSNQNISWAGSYFFKYKKPYNNEDIKFSLFLNKNEKMEIECNLKEAKNVKDITNLGPSDTNKNITITGVVHEKKDVLEMTFLNNLSEENIGVFYEKFMEENQSEGIKLIDANNEVVLGKKIEGINGEQNKFSFDITNLKKPFKVVIPQIEIYIHEEVSSSEVIELPIPKENEEIFIDEEISLEIKNKLVEGSNTKINIESIKREDENCTMKLTFPKYDKEEIQLINCVIVPDGDSLLKNGEDWFEGGLSGFRDIEDEKYVRELSFKLPYVDADKLFVKIRGSEYRIMGPWEMVVD